MESALLEKVRDIKASDPSAGYRAIHSCLKSDPGFETVSLKKVQIALQQLKQEEGSDGKPATGVAGPGENIWTAAADGDFARVEELMQVEGWRPGSADENGFTPVHAAASWARMDVLQMLLSVDGSATNAKDTDGDTPLHHVANATELEEDQVRDVVGLLLASRADPMLKNNDGWTSLDVCCPSLTTRGGEEENEDDADNELELNLNFIKVLSEQGYKTDSEM
mmetsp:Transcript_95114/g.188423  ORF Transcript_95114/g.188423 Transcript_95114/m.188423 type:complete len:223 (+) Transcript_95114:51-719(+)